MKDNNDSNKPASQQASNLGNDSNLSNGADDNSDSFDNSDSMPAASKLASLQGRLAHLVNGGRLTLDVWQGNSYICLMPSDGTLRKVSVLTDEVYHFPLENLEFKRNWKVYLSNDAFRG